MLNNTFTLLGQQIYYSDAIGNLLGLLGLYLSLSLKSANWLVQILSGFILAYTYFQAHLIGGVGKQCIIIIASCYGLYRWSKHKIRKQHIETNVASPSEHSVRWSTPTERFAIVTALICGTFILGSIFSFYPKLSWSPWLDAYLFVGSLLATIALSYYLIEFWLLWIIVDLVGIPLAYSSGLIFSAWIYIIYLLIVVKGFISWIRETYRN